MRAIAFHAGGLLLVVVVASISLYVGAFASFLTSVCNDSRGVVEAHRHTLQATVFCIGLGNAAVPGLWALTAKKKHRAALPWAVTSGAFILATLVMAVTVKPQQWCLF